MDILHITIKSDTQLSVILRYTDIYTSWCKSVTVYTTATYNKRRYKDGTVCPHIFDVKDFDKGFVQFLNEHYANRALQAINSHLRGHWAEDTGVNGGF